MKNAMSFSAATLMFLMCTSIAVSAQTVVWKGGTPGRPTDWNCSSNWEGNRVPNEFSEVIIQNGATFYPVITMPVGDIDALLVYSEASLDIREGGELLVLGETGRSGGALIYGSMMNQGYFEVKQLARENVAMLNRVRGTGVVEYKDSLSAAKK